MASYNHCSTQQPYLAALLCRRSHMLAGCCQASMSSSFALPDMPIQVMTTCACFRAVAQAVTDIEQAEGGLEDLLTPILMHAPAGGPLSSLRSGPGGGSPIQGVLPAVPLRLAGGNSLDTMACPAFCWSLQRLWQAQQSLSDCAVARGLLWCTAQILACRKRTSAILEHSGGGGGGGGHTRPGPACCTGAR